MKILRIFGIVAAVHFFAFVFIMANPGCSTKSKNASPVGAGDSMSSAPVASATEAGSPFAPMTGAAAQPESGGLSFDPNAIAGGSRFTPTRPNTPAAGALQAEPAADVLPPTTVTVGKGDSLWSLSKRAGVPVTELASANNLKTSSVLQVGQKLVVPGKVSATPSVKVTPAAKGSAVVTGAPAAKAPAPETTPAKAGPRPGTIIHVVKPGEILGVIARKYGVKAADIAVANNITNPALIPAGRELIIPVGKAKASNGTTAPTTTKSTTPATQHPVEVEPAREPAATPVAQPTSTRQQRPVMPVIGNPSDSQDLDSGLAPTSTSTVPVIKIEDEGAPHM